MIIPLKQGDTAEAIQATFTYQDTRRSLDVPVGTPVTFTMTEADDDWEPSGTTMIDGEDAEVVSSRNGVLVLRYQPVAGDTDGVGRYVGVFKLTLGSGQLTVPTEGFMRIEIEENL